MKFTSVALALVAAATSTNAFAPSTTSFVTTSSFRRTAPAAGPLFAGLQQHSEEEESLLEVEVADDNVSNSIQMSKIALLATSAWTVTSQMAGAAGPDWGIFEGRTLSLLHPTMMVSMLTFSIWTATLGFAWRRQRTMGDEISTLKKTMPDLQGATTVSLALEAARSAESVDNARISLLQSATAIEASIAELVAERKELVAKNPKDQHFSQGALLAFLGTSFAIEGPLNTYARAGKLFPGPHLYAGAGLVVLWGLAVACVPAMQKGNDTARYVHIGANAAGMGLFGWQVVSGWPILMKVIEKTQWP